MKKEKYSIWSIKRMAKEFGFKFYQGNGYCYFTTTDDNDIMLECESVGVCYWDQANLIFWERELQHKIFQQTNYNNYEKYQASKYWDHAYSRAKELKYEGVIIL